MENENPHVHILIVSYPAQGHINPTLRLAKLLTQKFPVRVTFSTAQSAQLPPLLPNNNNNNLLSYIPFSNGFDHGFDSTKHDTNSFFSQSKHNSSASLSTILDSLAARRTPVTCIIYSFFMSFAAHLARARNIPSFLFWIQPATAFAAYFHYFHGHINNLSTNPFNFVTLPKLPPMQLRDLPSFILSETQNSTTGDNNNNNYAALTPLIREMFNELEEGKGKAKVIVNTADEMEKAAMASVADCVELVGIGPLLGDIVDHENHEEIEYWLDGREEGSVVYVSFGSISVLGREQMEEIRRGLRECGRDYLWVVRRENRWEGFERIEEEIVREGKGMVVDWCMQGKVLGHKALGCFVTHCGWNSTVESLLCGVPTVGVPQWTDQMTNVWLMEKEWRVGMRVEVGENGLVGAEELIRCVEFVMGGSKEGEDIRRNAGIWKEKVRHATREGGSSFRNLADFVKEINVL